MTDRLTTAEEDRRALVAEVKRLRRIIDGEATLDELAVDQGVGPVTDISQVQMTHDMTEAEVEEFLGSLAEMRRSPLDIRNAALEEAAAVCDGTCMDLRLQRDGDTLLTLAIAQEQAEILEHVVTAIRQLKEGQDSES